MQNSFLKLSFFSLLLIFLASCGEDTGLPGGGFGSGPEGPSVSLVGGSNQVSGDAIVGAGGTFTVQISAQAGEALLSVFTVKKNGTNVPFSQLSFDKTDIGANPALLLNEAYKTSINFTIQVTTDANSTLPDTYTFEVGDENRETESTSITISYESTPPTISFVEQTPYFFSDKVCPPDSRFTVRVVGNRGSADIQTISVLENGSLITDLSRILINDFELFDNPTEVADDSKSDFDFEVSIKLGSDLGTDNYEIVTTDASGQTASVSLNVTTGSTITDLTGKLLLNQAGPAGTGGINLLTGEGVGSRDASAQLKDEGIDTEMSDANNWKQQVSGANGAVIRALGSNQPETFSFDNIQLSEQIVDLFNSGSSLSLQNNQGDLITAKLQTGDIILVQQGENYFAVRVDNVNVTANDNSDFYELSIKY